METKAKNRLEVLKSLLDDTAVIEVVGPDVMCDVTDAGRRLRRETNYDRMIDLEKESFLIMSGLAWENILKNQSKSNLNHKLNHKLNYTLSNITPINLHTIGMINYQYVFRKNEMFFYNSNWSRLNNIKKRYSPGV
jgi:hypothetical protein